jgi:hypothetical protein
MRKAQIGSDTRLCTNWASSLHMAAQSVQHFLQ